MPVRPTPPFRLYPPPSINCVLYLLSPVHPRKHPPLSLHLHRDYALPIDCFVTRRPHPLQLFIFPSRAVDPNINQHESLSLGGGGSRSSMYIKVITLTPRGSGTKIRLRNAIHTHCTALTPSPPPNLLLNSNSASRTTSG